MRPDRAAAQSAAKKKQTQGSRRDDWLPPLEIGGAFIVYEFALSLVCPAPEKGGSSGHRRPLACSLSHEYNTPPPFDEFTTWGGCLHCA